MLLIIAGVVLLWLAWGLRGVELLQQGNEVIELAQAKRATPTDIERGQDAFRAAREFNPDVTPLIQEGLLILLDRQAEAAVKLARETADREPDNFNAVYLLYLAAQAAGNHDAASDARRRIRKLNPLRIDDLGQPLSGGP
jgi:tetratricopeptide (TPR) repeat protein